ncbi:uncharacterized protein TNCV_948761 [Trichonephila clavipes]|nr:uncharacterized protein TNCV_948761 [Trichonephila clavipes]
MLTLWSIPLLQDNIESFIIQLDGSPPQWAANMRDYLDEHLPYGWIERIANYNIPLTQWLSISTDLTFCDFFQSGYLKEGVFVPTVPVDLAELKQRIKLVVIEFNSEALTHIRTKMDYWINVYHGTEGVRM